MADYLGVIFYILVVAYTNIFYEQKILLPET